MTNYPHLNLICHTISHLHPHNSMTFSHMRCSLLSDLEAPTLELVCHQEHGQVLVDAAQATAVYLDKLEGRGLEKLLKHHPVLTLDKK